MSPSPDAPEPREAAFTKRLLAWYAAHRRDLPWRRTRDPYAIWVSEMMLQQTQVATVIPYWTRWMERFPTVGALADAPLDEVLKEWQGLGYYARARNLHRAAQVIRDEHGGTFPTTFDQVLALPGIGRYTAGAICSIALGLDTPIVDANVIRVLCRVFGVRGDPKSPKVQERLWEIAARLIPPGQASEFNQGMMELGALICGSSPRCEICPMREICAAYASGDPTSLPEFAPRPEFTRQTDVCALISPAPGDPRLLLVRRPEGGLWGGLWEFPRVTATEGETAATTAERAGREIAGLAVRAADDIPAATVKHGVTTRRITLLALPCVMVAAESDVPAPATGFTTAWVRLEDLSRFALSSPQRRLTEQLQERTMQPSLF